MLLLHVLEPLMHAACMMSGWLQGIHQIDEA